MSAISLMPSPLWGGAVDISIPRLLVNVVTFFGGIPLALPMSDMTREINNGWTIFFKKNVHMYSHGLSVSKGAWQYQIPCEDSPLIDIGVLMWLYELNLDDAIFQDLLAGLTQWANSSGMKYRLYLTRDEYRTV